MAEVLAEPALVEPPAAPRRPGPAAGPGKEARQAPAEQRRPAAGGPPGEARVELQRSAGRPAPVDRRPCDGSRLVQNFNQSWKFKRADVTGAEVTAFDDSAWDDVGLPHSFTLPYFLPTNMSLKVYVGYGWYRKHFTVPSTWSGKSVSLEFQAAFDQAQIYVNGKQVGEHIGGYNGFSIDISSAIKPGDNVVAVRLNNNWNAQLPPITGDHTFQGGLYRDVNVVVTDPLHVTWYGTWVTTPTLAASSGSSSTVEIKTEVQNNRAAAVNVTLKTDIVDKDGKVVTTISSQQQIDAGKTVTFDQTTPAISSPALWHPDHPTLYKALSHLSDAAGIVDEFTTTFGFRWFSWSATQGFSLNGAHYWIQGGNVHQDHAGWGIGVARLGALPRRQDGQGRGHELHSRLALPEGAGLCQRLRSSSAFCSGRRTASGAASAAARGAGRIAARTRAAPPTSTSTTPTFSRASRT